MDLTIRYIEEEENFFSIKILPLEKYREDGETVMLIFSDVT
ncbi:hypothetical protein LEP1GSC016_4180 [Leptospira borgpetersenii serovar Hardjo-bovis str. Sponselee]|uniref:Uncharacterized protein n=1 Tax=Leptospira borgpetersenii serovar Hardjo-bovis str. Sponselee TaxID=1303729 RepID=M6BSP6_LEPBO|nr:hypothetical protein LEP1GSC016_4180 [Leptospira borgpetersenii serovar Hardjo-bovis str. Sponselee]